MKYFFNLLTVFSYTVDSLFALLTAMVLCNDEDSNPTPTEIFYVWVVLFILAIFGTAWIITT